MPRTILHGQQMHIELAADNQCYMKTHPKNPKTKTRGSVLIQLEG